MFLCFNVLIKLVAGAGLEPATCGLWARRAANCSTPRYLIAIVILAHNFVFGKHYWLLYFNKSAKINIIIIN